MIGKYITYELGLKQNSYWQRWHVDLQSLVLIAKQLCNAKFYTRKYFHITYIAIVVYADLPLTQYNTILQPQTKLSMGIR